MSSLFTARQAAIASITAAALILVSQVLQLALPLIISESVWNATQMLRMGLALMAMFVLLLALTGLHARQASAAGALGLIGYVAASLGTLLVAGDWWYETFIAERLDLDWSRPHLRHLRSRLGDLRARDDPGERLSPTRSPAVDRLRYRGRPRPDLPVPDPAGPRGRVDGHVARPLGRS